MQLSRMCDEGLRDFRWLPLLNELIHTWMSNTMKHRISNLTVMGAHELTCLCFLTPQQTKFAYMRNSWPLPSCLIFHMNAGMYCTIPADASRNKLYYELKMGPLQNLGLSASSDTEDVYFDIIGWAPALHPGAFVAFHSSLGSDQGFHQCWKMVQHELKLAIGRINDMVQSFSNCEFFRTHWWNVTSSISIALPCAVQPMHNLVIQA